MPVDQSTWSTYCDQPFDRLTYWSTYINAYEISILQVKVDVYMKLLNSIFWSTSQQVDIAVDTQNMGKITK